MNLHTCMLTDNDCYQAGRTIRPQGVMVHSTGANNPSLKRYVQPDDGLLGKNQYGNHWNRSGVGACVHAFIGKLADGSVATYQTLPWNARGWHCGRSGNDTHLSFEICEDDLSNDAYFAAVYREAVELTAYLCRMYGLDPQADGVVLDHAEGNKRGIASGHSDVGHWFSRHGKTMDGFRAAVARELMAADTAAKEDNDMSKDELMQAIRTALQEDRAARTYATLDKVPAWAKPTVEPLVASGIIQGNGKDLGLSYDLCRTLVILDRLGKL